MVATWKQVNPDEVLNHGKIGVKSLVITAILTLGYSNVKKEVLKTWVWAAMLALTVLNILIAVSL